ncbi:MAG: aminotransferase class I/II-fold pyridoxal phosphate-dependent enzyme [Salinivirgaceae bacterium]|jgi:aspartate/methionine/tyrosine aminotransferase|nr:aminotransferase class I/II-fold pyridoxal phosphate-dependent enzyme [Salinivirgaceae bacterium]
MRIVGKPKLKLRQEVRDFIDLYQSLGQRAENFLPRHIIDNLKSFTRLCYDEPDDPILQQREIDRQLLELKEAIPGYTDVSLMIFPHEESKAFEYRSKKNVFRQRLVSLIDTEAINEEEQKQAKNILNTHDYSVGTPPVTQRNLNFRYTILLGDQVSELRKFREVLGIKDEVEEAQWNYLLDVFDQMVVQSSHYTTAAEKTDFLTRSEQTINFKGLNGFLKTVVSGSSDTAVKLIKEELFNPVIVQDLTFTDEETLFNTVKEDTTSIFVIRIPHMRKNLFNNPKWFPLLTRMIFIDASDLSKSTNTSLIFCLHNQIVQTLNKVHTKKLGALANSQLNLRLILEKVSTKNLEHFKSLIQGKINDYNTEIDLLKKEQLGATNNLEKDIVLFKFDEFSRQILKDRYSLEKLRDYIDMILNCTSAETLKKQNKQLIQEFEDRTKKYFYSDNKEIEIATIVEGGGRNQIKTYGEYLLQRKLKPVDKAIIDRCRVILDIIPDTFQRTLKNHFHKNFGINLFLEKYKEYLIKAENDADNKGRFSNFLIDLGIFEKFNALSKKDQDIVKEFISSLSNLNKTSISDDVQMIIRDVLFGKEDKTLKPYILFNKYSSWEYMDLFPTDRFDINPFDMEIGIDEEGRIDYDRLTTRLDRMKNTFQVFDESGNLWDSFCENLTIVINDPSNPSGYSDFNNQSMLRFLKSVSTSKITLFLDEAYNDSVKISSEIEPKWRTISKYVMNNLNQQYARINFVSSISTTKNLGATGDRLGSLVASPAKKDVIDFAHKQNSVESGNTNSLFMLVNILETAQLSKSIKDNLEERLPKNASRNKIKQRIETYIIAEIDSYRRKQNSKSSKELLRFSPFEGSPLHMFLLNELVSLDKLDVLELPDDFKYLDEPFFTYYQKQLVKDINAFRVNKNFRNEALLRLKIAKETATELLSGEAGEHAKIIASDGSFLFNIQLKDFFSYQDLEKFTKKLAEERGIAVIPYQTGFLRFSMGDYLDGTEKGYDIFRKEFKNALEIVLKYWLQFYNAKNDVKNKELSSDKLLSKLFEAKSDRIFMRQVLEDFHMVRDLIKTLSNSLRINNVWTLYHASAGMSGVSINTIGSSKNSVIEFSEEVGKCTDLTSFIRSVAFTSIYENMLPQIYKNIPMIKHLDFGKVLARYGKSTLLKYITAKLNYQPTDYILDAPEDDVIIAEILIEMERILFSPAKTKVLAINSTGKHADDIARLEGVNMVLRKHIQELMLHFNLPFENDPAEPSLMELVNKGLEKFKWITGKKTSNIDAAYLLKHLSINIYDEFIAKDIIVGSKLYGSIEKLINDKVLDPKISSDEKIKRLYLLSRKEFFHNKVVALAERFNSKLVALDDMEIEAIIGEFLHKSLPAEIEDIWNQVVELGKLNIDGEKLHREVRWFTLFLINLMNQTKSNEHYDRYTHSIIHLTEAEFAQQNSAINEMVQHGISVHQNYDIKNHPLEKYNNGSLKWLASIMRECGVVGTEKNVQTHTRIATDAKKREYAFYRIDRLVNDKEKAAKEKALALSEENSNEYIKILDTRPLGSFFVNRLAKFAANMDMGDYRCKIFNGGLVNELFIYHKSYMKYMADNYRLLDIQDASLEDAKNFVPDTICFYGAPTKVVSFPRVGYFDINGPNGKIKTVVTPLTNKGDYYGNIKKPRLTIMNEKVKDMGGIPVHGSMFAVEEEDGAMFVVQIAGDSGVGKSEMVAAMMLKWMKNNLTGVRSLKMIAGDMFHVFPDSEGNLYGIGTEVGDFSRITDFDPDYIKFYNSLFESSADSNVEDLNSRSTISGLCDVSMPFKIDIMLTASNFAREEAGITRYENPENFILYRDSHGERREKATSGDNPHFQRTLMRYPSDKNIVDVLDKHGSYIDDMVDWEKDDFTGVFYLCSSYKMIDKIDLNEVINKIFVEKEFAKNGEKYTIKSVTFDIIKNRFIALVANEENEISTVIDRGLFNQIFNALASTPGGQPFIDEGGENDGKRHLVEVLKSGEGKKIQLGILSTDIGRTGKEITGPQMAAEDMRKLIREVRIARPEINQNKNIVKKQILACYKHIFDGEYGNSEIFRYNFWLWQMEQMRKAKFVRIDDKNKHVDLSKLKGFKPEAKDKVFSPLIVTPNMNIELSSYGETYLQLMNLPDIAEFALEFSEIAENLFIAESYSQETIVNNMIIQLLLMNGYILKEDLTRGSIFEKVNRETIAAAKYAALEILNRKKNGKKDPTITK